MEEMDMLVKAPAKINLTLDVLHKRDDGYHEVQMVMTSIDLADRLGIKRLTNGRVEVRSSASFVPQDERNLAYQAARLLQKRFQMTQGASIYIEKNIPVAAGLAGGSTDAAQTLMALNRLWQLGCSTEELATLGAEIGSDVSFCVYGGTALAEGRGEKITPISSPPPFWVVLAKPAEGISTGSIYQQLRLEDLSRPDTQGMLHAIETGHFQGMIDHMGNVLESVTLRVYPEVARLKLQMQKFGAEGVLMSGSGPTVYALTQKQSRARRIYNGLKGFCREVYLVRSLSRCNRP